MVWESFSGYAKNEVPLTMLRTNELKMTKTTVSQVKTYASQLSGSIWLLLHAKNVFQVRLGKGKNLVICQGKGGIYSPR